MKFEEYMLLEADEAEKIAKSGEKIVFDKETVDSLYNDIKKELDRLPDEAIESTCVIMSQLLSLAKEALRALTVHNTDEVLVSLYEMLKAYYKACEEREKKKEEEAKKAEGKTE